MQGYEVLMVKLLSICALAGLATVAIAAAAYAQDQPPPPQYSATLKVGDVAPDFSLPGSDGKTHKLSDYRGKYVALAWFPKAFTGG